MEPWLIAAVTVLVPSSGGGLWAALRAWMRAQERREEARRQHESDMVSRFEKMQAGFLEALQRMEAGLERHRTEHLEDVKLSAQRMSEAIAAVQAIQARSSSRPSSQSTTPSSPTSERK